ncbi:hypothetical protein CAAR111675_07335 [Campylobacter armoricus]
MGENLNIEQDEFVTLSEDDVMMALGEKVTTNKPVSKTQDEIATKDDKMVNTQEDEMVNELSKSIAQTITSSITDDTLKAALKGMKMNININISFDEDKH